MSLLTLAATAAAAYPFQSGFAASFALGLIRPRNIGPFVCDVTISERHRDEMVITQHPVEVGSVMADHAYKKPIHLVLTVGFSNSSLRALGDANYVQTVYNNFLTLQQNALPFSVTTGKRTVDNLLIESINELTNEQTENALILELACSEVILVNTSTASTTATGMSTASSNLSAPAVNAPPAAQGTQQLQSGDNINMSSLYNTGVSRTAISAP